MKENSWGAIFDWDGVLIDSAEMHRLGWERLAEKEGLPLPKDHFIQGFGRKNHEIIPHILNWSQEPAEIRRLSFAKEEAYRAIVREKGVVLLPGAETWIGRLRQAGIPCIVASSTDRANLNLIFDLLKIHSWFKGMVSSEDVTHGKPHPEPFLLAARKIDRPPERCVVFEDAKVGIQAGLAAGMKVVGVATTHEPSELGNASHVVRRLDELEVEQLGRWFVE